MRHCEQILINICTLRIGDLKIHFLKKYKLQSLKWLIKSDSSKI